MRCAILQPSYIPWRGYFDLIRKVDVFVFYDCVQYDDRGWRNRNRIRTRNGTQWLSIPVRSRGAQRDSTPIREIPIVWDSPWNEKHLAAITHNYSKAPYWKTYLPLLKEYYTRRDALLADFTIDFTVALSGALGITNSRFLRSSSLPARGAKTDRLLSILEHLEADHYISGPSAAAYLDLEKFRALGITVEYMTYNYPEYSQLHGPFEAKLSVVDLLLMTGPEAHRYLNESPGKATS